jgi:hypothetical protein
MMRRSGSADLPLHGGRVPKWLGDRMTRLSAVITEAMVLEYGPVEVLRRLAHPFWFQSFGAVMGMDWHSSGTTTSVIGTLKRGLPSRGLGVHMCGGRGANRVATLRPSSGSACIESARRVYRPRHRCCTRYIREYRQAAPPRSCAAGTGRRSRVEPRNEVEHPLAHKRHHMVRRRVAADADHRLARQGLNKSVNGS